jgi:hypothetical protein
MARFQQKQITLNDKKQPGRENAANYLQEGDRQYGASEMIPLAVVQPQLNDVTTTPALATFGEPLE